MERSPNILKWTLAASLGCFAVGAALVSETIETEIRFLKANLGFNRWKP